MAYAEMETHILLLYYMVSKHSKNSSGKQLLGVATVNDNKAYQRLTKSGRRGC